MFVDPTLAFIPRIILLSDTARSRLERTWLVPVELLVFLIILANAPGSLYLHSLPIQYDRFLHYIAGFLVMLLSIPVLGPLFKHSANVRRRSRLVIVAAGLVFVGLFAFEFYQWSVDRLLGTKLFYDVAQPIEVDVVEDITFGTLGLLTASFFMRLPVVWKWLTQGERVREPSLP